MKTFTQIFRKLETFKQWFFCWFWAFFKASLPSEYDAIAKIWWVYCGSRILCRFQISNWSSATSLGNWKNRPFFVIKFSNHLHTNTYCVGALGEKKIIFLRISFTTIPDLLAFSPGRICFPLIWILGRVPDIQKLSKSKIVIFCIFFDFLMPSIMGDPKHKVLFIAECRIYLVTSCPNFNKISWQ